MSTLAVSIAFLRRYVGAAGAPSTLKSGVPFHNEVEDVLYIAKGDDGSGNSTSRKAIGGVGAFVDLVSAQAVAGQKTFGANPIVPNGSAANHAAAFGQIAAALAAYAPLASAVLTSPSLNAAPLANDNSNLVPSTAWVQALFSALAAGLTPKPTATVATAAALPTYTANNSQKTLTATTNGALTVDGYAAAVGDLVLVNQESGAAAPNNGLYVVTTTGAAGAAWSLTRHVDMAIASEFKGAFIPVGNAGATTANTLWLCNPAGAVTLGSTAIPFVQMNSPTALIQGAGIALSGNAIAVAGASALTAGQLLKWDGSKVLAAVAGTDYTAPFSSIDPGTA